MKTATRSQIRTVCRMCHGGCGVIAEVHGEKIVGLRGDPDNPNNYGFLCAKGRASIELLRHPQRLTQPLERVGDKGSSDFRAIPWEDALGRIAERLQRCRERHGAESVVLAQGTDRNYQEWLFRFANAFGSPNVLGPAHVCFYPRVMAGILSMGAFTFCDYEGKPDCIMVWGSNKAHTHGDGVIGVRLIEALGQGASLIVVDPRRTVLARRADIWLRPRPGSDAALALSMLHVIVREQLYDRAFVHDHCHGFDRLAEHLEAYGPGQTESATGVPADLLVKAARLYAGAPAAAIEAGTGIEQNRDSFHTARALVILSAICGNIDRPGGDLIWQPSGIIGRRTLPATHRLPEGMAGKRLGGERHRLLSMAGWAQPAAVWKAILEQEPYAVAAMLVLGSNLLVSYAGSDRVHRALHRLPFLAVCDLFLTPTAKMADLVLPVASWLERDQIVEHAHYVAARRQIETVGEARSDESILNALAQRLGLDGFWTDADASLEDRLRPIGSSWRRLCRQAYRANDKSYFKYRHQGFDTRDGKFQIVSGGLAALGYEPLPIFRGMAAASEVGPEHPYLLTSFHSKYFFNSEFRQLKSLRDKEPEPRVEMHPEDARRERVSDGDWLELSVAQGGRARFRAHITGAVAPGVLAASAGWWYPECPTDSSWRQSNVNLLTSDGSENEEMGSSNFRGISCRVRRLGGG